MDRNINVWLPLAHPPTGDLACNPGMCPDWESNWRPFGSQAGAQSTEPHQPGPYLFTFYRGIMLSKSPDRDNGRLLVLLQQC